jgi:hypothetical protein
VETAKGKMPGRVSVPLDGFKDASQILFEPHVDLQTVQEFRLVSPEVLQERGGVQGRGPRLGIQNPVGQRFLVQAPELWVLEDEIEYPLGQRFVHGRNLLFRPTERIIASKTPSGKTDPLDDSRACSDDREKESGRFNGLEGEFR